MDQDKEGRIMYGVRDNFERSKSYNSPELSEAMKAKRNAIAFVSIVVTVVGGLLWTMIVFTPPYVWGPVLAIVGSAALIVWLINFGFAMIESGFDWVGEQFEIWKNAKEYGVRDE